MRVEGAGDFKRAAAALTNLGERDVRQAQLRGLRNSGRPTGQDMVRGGARVLPRRGGLSARVARSTATVTGGLVGRNARVTVALRSPDDYHLEAMDRGEVLHPVFARPGRRPAWVRQSVPAGGFTRAFNAGAPQVRGNLRREIQRAIDAAARKV